MSNLPLEIIETIISILAEDDVSLSSTKTCALVCHTFHHICRKHIFASISLEDCQRRKRTKATTPMLQRLLDTSPEIARHIRHLHHNIGSDFSREGSFLETFTKITCLKSLCINGVKLQWNEHPFLLAWLHLLHLPTLTYLKLFSVNHFFISDLAHCINLEHFQFDHLTILGPHNSHLLDKSVRLRKISAGNKSAEAVMKMSTMQCADGKPFIEFDHLDELSIKIWRPPDIQALSNLLSRCKKLINIDVDIQVLTCIADFTQIGLTKMLHPSTQTLKHLCVRTCFAEENESNDPLAGLSNELEEMRNKNIIETIAIQVDVETDSDCRRGDEWGPLDTALTQPGWPKLRRVSLTIVIWSYSRADDSLERALKKLPQTQFPKLSSHKSLSFEFSVRGELV